MKGFILVDAASSSTVPLPASRQDFRGDSDVIVDFTPPRHSASAGRVLTEGGAEYYPSVFGLEIRRAP